MGEESRRGEGDGSEVQKTCSKQQQEGRMGQRKKGREGGERSTAHAHAHAHAHARYAPGACSASVPRWFPPTARGSDTHKSDTHKSDTHTLARTVSLGGLRVRGCDCQGGRARSPSLIAMSPPLLRRSTAGIPTPPHLLQRVLLVPDFLAVLFNGDALLSKGTGHLSDQGVCVGGGEEGERGGGARRCHRMGMAVGAVWRRHARTHTSARGCECVGGGGGGGREGGHQHACAAQWEAQWAAHLE